MTPSFRYTHNKKEWPYAIFLPLLMRHGAPPPGVKWYGGRQVLHLTSSEARQWSAQIVLDCRAAVSKSKFLGKFADNYRTMWASHIKNEFLTWCRDERKKV